VPSTDWQRLYGLCVLTSGPLNGDDKDAFAILQRVVTELDRYCQNDILLEFAIEIRILVI
jgi:hypothetical protein